MRTFQQVVEGLRTDATESGRWLTRSYSGRNMHGRECLAVSVYEGEEGSFFADLLRYVAKNPAEVEIVANAIRDFKTDTMGRGYVLYFSNVPFDKG